MPQLEVLEMIERMPGVTAKRGRVPPALLKGIKTFTGPFHPGLRYLLDMLVAESVHPYGAMLASRALAWTGTTGVAAAIERWMREGRKTDAQPCRRTTEGHINREGTHA